MDVTTSLGLQDRSLEERAMENSIEVGDFDQFATLGLSAPTMEERVAAATNRAADAGGDADEFAVAQSAAALAGGASAIEAVTVRLSGAMTAARSSWSALTPSVLNTIARRVMLRGEALVIPVHVKDGVFDLLHSAEWDVYGGVRKSDWVYEANVYGPSDTRRLQRRRDSVIHVMRDVDPLMPWKGSSPLNGARVTSILSSQIEKALLDDAKISPGEFLPVPNQHAAKGAKIRNQMSRVRSHLMFPPAGSSNSNTKADNAWKTVHTGPKPDQALVTLARNVESRLVSADGRIARAYRSRREQRSQPRSQASVPDRCR